MLTRTRYAANYIGKKEDVYAAFRLTEQDERQIRELAQVMRCVFPNACCAHCGVSVF